MIKGKEAQELLESLKIKRFDCAKCRAKFRGNQVATIKNGKIYCKHHSDGEEIVIPNRSV